MSWQYYDSFNVIQAVLFILGKDESYLEDVMYYDEESEDFILEEDELPKKFRLVKNAIVNALISESLITNRFWNFDSTINLSKTVISRKTLNAWLDENKSLSKYYTPTWDYLNPDHPHYSNKLAATVNAWLAFSDKTTKKKSAKQLLKEWLQENAKQYGLIKPDGKLNETGIEECAKIANWEPDGGAPKTLEQ